MALFGLGKTNERRQSRRDIGIDGDGRQTGQRQKMHQIASETTDTAHKLIHEETSILVFSSYRRKLATSKKKRRARKEAKGGSGKFAQPSCYA